VTGSLARSTAGEGQIAPEKPVGLAGWNPALWKVWLVLAVFLVIQALPLIYDQTAQEPDDYVRLLQVRDLLNGQNWFDTRQYRMDPPVGMEMHWVRLVDLPIAAALALFKLILRPDWAETAAMSVVPLGQLYVAMLIARGIMRELGLTQSQILPAIAAIPLFPLLMTNFMPMRIDHHGWQAIGALVATWMLVRGTYRSALIGGAAAAAWIYISVEAMPLAAIVGAVYAWRYWWYGRREVEGFLLGLALTGPALFPLLRPLSDYASAYCDMMSWPHFIAFAASAAVLVLGRFMPGQDSRTGRLLALLPVPLVAAPALLLPLGICAVSPMATLDPLLRDHWFVYLIESAPLWKQHLSSAGMLLATIAVIGFGLRLALAQPQSVEARRKWIDYGVTAVGAGAISLVVMRGGINAQLLALPFTALILTCYLPRVRAIGSMPGRVLATFLCFLAATPALASGALKWFDGKTAYTLVAHPHLNEDGPCDIRKLRQLPKSHLFATIDRGPEILVRTQHTAIVGGYHRNQKKMIEVFNAFSGPLDQAEAIVKANRADYVMACTGSPDLAAYANFGKDNLADAIFARKLPNWLGTVPGYDRGNLRIYRVK
jgi:hypothetical protein